jgi:hypothetical protein
MGTVNGTNYAKAADPTPANILGKGLFPGNVKVMVDDYTFASASSGEVVRVAKLPAGAKVLFVLLANAALGSGVTLAVGNGGSGKGAIFAAAAAANAATTVPKVYGGITASGIPYVVGTLAGDDVVTVTTGGATASGKIQVMTFYTVE